MLGLTTAKQIGRLRAKVFWPSVIVVFLLLVIANRIMAALARSTERPPAGLVVGAELTGWLVAIIGGLALVFGTIQLVRWLVGLFSLSVEEEADKPKERPPGVLVPYASRVDEKLGNMREALARIEKRRMDATLQLVDVNQMSIALVGLVQATVKKAVQLEQQRRLMVELRQALVGGDLQRAAELVGEMGDQALIRLVNDPHADNYRDTLLTMLSTEVGGLHQMTTALLNLSREWVGQIGQARLEIERVGLLIDAAEAVPYVVEIRYHLDAATMALGFDMAGLERMVAARQLPTILGAPLQIEGANTR